MENTYWLKYIHQALRERGIVENRDFEFNESSKSQNAPLEIREKAPLVVVKDFYSNLREVTHENLSTFFCEIFDATTWEGDPDPTAWDLYTVNIFEKKYSNINEVIWLDLFRVVATWRKKFGPIAGLRACASYNGPDGMLEHEIDFGQDYGVISMSDASIIDGTENKYISLPPVIGSRLPWWRIFVDKNQIFTSQRLADHYIDFVTKLRATKIK